MKENNKLREVSFTTGINRHAEGSCLVKFGHTEVICTATVENRIPSWMKAQGRTDRGWVTAEYGMLPRSTSTRMEREAKKGQSGRTQEIQRLIARSLRSVVDLKSLKDMQVKVDCDVIQADGGTRVASICGGFLALYQALKSCGKEGAVSGCVAAVSCGIINGEVVLDLDYEKDSTAQVDANFVMTDDGRIVEIQSTAEEKPFTEEEFAAMLSLAKQGIAEISGLQRQAIKGL